MQPRPNAIGRRSPLPAEYEDLRDPANGARVPRCGACGVSGQAGNRVLTGSWTYRGFTMALSLCEACIRWHAPQDPQSGDPLRVGEDAA